MNKESVYAHRDIPLILLLSKREWMVRITVYGLWGSDQRAHLLRCGKNASGNRPIQRFAFLKRFVPCVPANVVRAPDRPRVECVDNVPREGV